MRNAERAAKTTNDAPHGRNFDLRRSVPDQVNLAVPDLSPHRHPAAIDRDARTLPLEWFDMLFFEEAFEATLRVATVLADHAQCAAFRRFTDHPVKVGRFICHEPHA